jgi:serine/threonine protein phosphatase PrpC
MEDSILAIYPFCDSEDLGLFGIFDGHGGTAIA